MGLERSLFFFGAATISFESSGRGALRHHASLQQRVDYLEKIMGDSADKHAAHMKKLEAPSAAETSFAPGMMRVLLWGFALWSTPLDGV